ncbi:MAG: hypothetical protein U1A28_00390, partial [Patescibacteria group bacterium]|nr:hypothetical protein [Patescibacteria group bacterium]
LILKGGSEEEIYTAARKNGFSTMKEDAICKVLEGLVPLEEVNTLGGALLEPTSEEAVVHSRAQDSESAP